MITREEFIEQLIQNLEAVLPDGPEYSIETQMVDKINGPMEAIIIREPDKSIAPSFYIDQLYENYQNGQDIGDILQQMAEIYQQPTLPPNPSVDTLLQNPVFIYAINKEANLDLINKCPHIDYGDLAILAKVDLGGEYNGTITVTNSVLEQMGITEGTLFRKGLEYTREKMPPLVSPLSKRLFGILAGEDSDVCRMDTTDSLGHLDRNEPMYVISNSTSTFGGVALMFKDEIDNLAKTLGDSVYLLPSSINEIICVPASSAPDRETLLSMVKEINSTEVSPQEVLSDSIYYYDAEKSEMTMIGQDQIERPMRFQSTEKNMDREEKREAHHKGR